MCVPLCWSRPQQAAGLGRSDRCRCVVLHALARTCVQVRVELHQLLQARQEGGPA